MRARPSLWDYYYVTIGDDELTWLARTTPVPHRSGDVSRRRHTVIFFLIYFTLALLNTFFYIYLNYNEKRALNRVGRSYNEPISSVVVY